MKERPILFSGPMVRAILEGRKTQTRRVVKPHTLGDGTKMSPDLVAAEHIWMGSPSCPFGHPGDRLWVRDTWQWCDYDGPGGEPMTDVVYRADGETDDKRKGWRPSIFMYRYASRITLEVAAVRVERLRDISEADAEAEGAVLRYDDPNRVDRRHPKYSEGFKTLWESINGPGSWAANPWVWVVEFKRVTP